jgi:hypothetical protein
MKIEKNITTIEQVFKLSHEEIKAWLVEVAQKSLGKDFPKEYIVSFRWGETEETRDDIYITLDKVISTEVKEEDE